MYIANIGLTQIIQLIFLLYPMYFQLFPSRYPVYPQYISSFITCIYAMFTLDKNLEYHGDNEVSSD